MSRYWPAILQAAYFRKPVKVIVFLVLLIVSLSYLSAGLYQPFLYKQF
jgi:hypothetical protein